MEAGGRAGGGKCGTIALSPLAAVLERTGWVCRPKTASPIAGCNHTISKTLRGIKIVHSHQVLSWREGVEPLSLQSIPGVESDDALLPQASGNLKAPHKHPPPFRRDTATATTSATKYRVRFILGPGASLPLSLCSLLPRHKASGGSLTLSHRAVLHVHCNGTSPFSPLLHHQIRSRTRKCVVP